MIVHPKREWISIHTSAREVTACAVMAYVDTNDFNPHFRKGSDEKDDDNDDETKKFQSTLPQGK